jgi:hypothetical protein
MVAASRCKQSARLRMAAFKGWETDEKRHPPGAACLNPWEDDYAVAVRSYTV